MEKLLKEVQSRIDFLDRLHDEEQQANEENKVFTIRLPISLLEQLNNIAMVLQTTKAEVARMILTNGADEIINTFQIKVSEQHGISFSDMYDLEIGEKTLKEVLEGKE